MLGINGSSSVDQRSICSHADDAFVESDQARPAVTAALLAISASTNATDRITLPDPGHVHRHRDTATSLPV